MAVYNMGVLPSKPSTAAFFGGGIAQGWQEAMAQQQELDKQKKLQELQAQTPEGQLAAMRLKAMQEADPASQQLALLGIDPIALEKAQLSLEALKGAPQNLSLPLLLGIQPGEYQELQDTSALTPDARLRMKGYAPEKQEVEQFTNAKLLEQLQAAPQDFWHRTSGTMDPTEQAIVEAKAKKAGDQTYLDPEMLGLLGRKAIAEDPYGERKTKATEMQAMAALLSSQASMEKAKATGTTAAEKGLPTPKDILANITDIAEKYNQAVSNPYVAAIPLNSFTAAINSLEDTTANLKRLPPPENMQEEQAREMTMRKYVEGAVENLASVKDSQAGIARVQQALASYIEQGGLPAAGRSIELLEKAMTKVKAKSGEQGLIAIAEDYLSVAFDYSEITGQDQRQRAMQAVESLMPQLGKPLIDKFIQERQNGSKETNDKAK